MPDVLLFAHDGRYQRHVTVAWRNVDHCLTPQETLREILFEQFSTLFSVAWDGCTAFCETVPGEDNPVVIHLGENEKPIEPEPAINWGLIRVVTVDVWSKSGLWIRSSRLRWEPQDGEVSDATFLRCLNEQLPELLNESTPPGHVLTCAPQGNFRANEVLRVTLK